MGPEDLGAGTILTSTQLIPTQPIAFHISLVQQALSRHWRGSNCHTRKEVKREALEGNLYCLPYLND